MRFMGISCPALTNFFYFIQLCHLPKDRYQVVGRVVHMDFVQKHLENKRDVEFKENQKQSNNIELEVLADTVYVKVNTCFIYGKKKTCMYTYLLCNIFEWHTAQYPTSD